MRGSGRDALAEITTTAEFDRRKKYLRAENCKWPDSMTEVPRERWGSLMQGLTLPAVRG